MAVNHVFLLVEVKPAKQLLDCQVIFLPPDVFTLLDISVGDYLRLNLPDGSCFIAKTEPIGRSHPKSQIKNSNGLVYLATCSGCVAANCSSTGATPSAPFMLALGQITVLEKVPIESLAVKVWFKTISAVLMYKKNKLLVVKTLQRILSMYGIISNCYIDLSANSVAEIFGIARVQVGNVKTCCLEDNTLTEGILDTDCPYVGYKFTCSNFDCKLNTKSTDVCRVAKPCEICSKNVVQLSKSWKAQCSLNKSSSSEASTQPYRTSNPTTAMLLGNLSVAKAKEECTFHVDVLNLSAPKILPHTDDFSNNSTSQTQPQIHDTPDQTHGTSNRTDDTTRPTHFPAIETSHTRKTAHEHVRYSRVTVCLVESLQQLQLRQEQQAVHVGGLDKAKDELRRLLREVSMKEVPGSSHVVVSGCGALLVGPAGCGKATLVRHLSAATATMLVTLCCRSMATSGSKGTTAEVFNEAQLLSQERPCILFLLHIEQLAALPLHSVKKDRWGLTEVRRSISSSLDAGCLIVASTSDAGRVPECLRNMFNTELLMGSSTLPYRDDVLRVLAASKHWAGLDHRKLAKLTPGYVGADLKQLMERVEELLAKQQKLPSNLTSDELTALAVAEVAHFTPHLIKSNPLLGERPVGVPLGGMDQLMAELQQILNQMIDSGSLFARLGLNVPRGVLLYGPPGCGKTQLVCALAASRGCTFFLVQPKHIVSPYVGETEQNLQAAFQAARTCRPSVVFFDEIDGLFGDRSGGQVSEVRQNLILEMLQILDGAGAENGRHSSMDGVLVCGATNNPDKLDAALLRPGRFDRLVYVPPPDPAQRLQILKVKCSGAELESEEVLEEIAAQTNLLTGADLEAIIREAVGEALLSGNVTTDGRVRLTSALVRKYAARTKPTVTQDTLRGYQAFRRR